MNVKEVLIIEDESRFRNSIKRALKDEGYSFVEAVSVEESLRKLYESPNLKVILLDLKLRDGSGRDFLERIKDRIHQYKVIVLTAHEEYLAAELAREFAVFTYLPKPKGTSIVQSIRFTIAQAFKDIEREGLKDKSQILNSIQEKITSNIQENTTDETALNDVLSFICQSVRTLVGAHTCHIRVYNLKKGDFDLAAFDGPNDEVRTVFNIEPRRKDELFSGKVATEKRPLLFEDLQNSEEFKAFREKSLKRVEHLNNDLLQKAEEYFNTIQSAFIAPITTRMFDDETDAIFNVSGDSVEFFSEEKKGIIKEFVTQATIAITKAWQKKRKEESHQDYKGISMVLEDISKKLRGKNVKKQIYRIATQGISEIIKPETITIFLFNRTTGLLDNEAEFRGEERFEPSKEGHPTDAGLTGWVYTNGEPLRLPNLQRRDRSTPQSHINYSEDLETDYVEHIPSGRVDHYLGVPMIIGNEVIGAIQLLNKKSEYYLNPEIDKERWLLERGFSDDCENVLGIAAGYLAVAINNAELLEERDRKISQLDTLKDVGRYTSREVPLDELLNKIIEEAAKDVQAEICLLFLLDESQSKVVLEQCYGIPKAIIEGAEYKIGEGLTGRVARTGKSELQKAEDPTGKYDDKYKEHLQETHGETGTIKSLMVVPIRAKGEILGVIKAINKKGVGEQYNEEDLSFFETFASYVGIAIENAQRYILASKTESNSTLSNLVASVAHEINNTYGLIPDDIDELKETIVYPNDEITSLLDEIKDLTMQMVYYANEIGGYSIGTMGEKKFLNINDVIKTAAQQIPEFRKPENFETISLNFNLSTSPLECLLHEKPLIRTIRNIIINAYQALGGKDKGEITITTNEDISANLAIIKIADNGCGIKEEHKPKIFEPEFTTKDKGSGIGLWLAKRHLDSIDGYITFNSDENQGTTFTLGISLHQDSDQQVTRNFQG